MSSKHYVVIGLFQDGLCDKNSVPSVSSITRILRGGKPDDKSDHSITGILGQSDLRALR